MKKLFILFALSMLIVSCSGVGNLTMDSNAFATAVAATEAAQATTAPQPTTPPDPTNTAEPTAFPTKRPTDIPKPTEIEVTLEQIQQGMLDITTRLVAGIDGVETVNMVRFNNGELEIETKNIFVSQDTQPDVSYKIIQAIAFAYIKGEMTPERLEKLAGGPDFKVKLVTYSVLGDYRYESITDYSTLEKVYNKQISYDEWVAAAQSGFK